MSTPVDAMVSPVSFNAVVDGLVDGGMSNVLSGVYVAPLISNEHVALFQFMVDVTRKSCMLQLK